jgi:hypothetical protein
LLHRVRDLQYHQEYAYMNLIATNTQDGLKIFQYFPFPRSNHVLGKIVVGLSKEVVHCLLEFIC